MDRFRLDWPGVAAFAVAVAAAVAAGIWVDMDAAKVIAGLAGGLLVRVGALGMKGTGVDVPLDDLEATK